MKRNVTARDPSQPEHKQRCLADLRGTTGERFEKRTRICDGKLPALSALPFNGQRFPRLQVRDDLVDLQAVKCALDPQPRGQHDHDIAVRQQQIPRGNIAVRDERLNGLLAERCCGGDRGLGGDRQPQRQPQQGDDAVGLLEHAAHRPQP